MDVSVVIACRNRERRIGAAVESALAQDVPPREVVVVDDGSTDRSPEIVAGYGPPVRLIRSEHRGVSGARNVGIAAASGEWIAFLDSDDVWLPGKLKRQAEALAAFPQVDLVFCDTELCDVSGMRVASRFALGGVRGLERERRDDLLVFDRSLLERLFEQSRIFPSSVIVRRRLPNLRFNESERVAEDWRLWLVLARHHRFAAVDRVLVRMHWDGDNVSCRRGEVEGAAVRVLEAFAADPELQEHERAAVLRALPKRRRGAVYHSLAEGRGSDARRFLRDLPPADLPVFRRLLYHALSHLPGAALRALARARGADPAETPR